MLKRLGLHIRKSSSVRTINALIILNAVHTLYRYICKRLHLGGGPTMKGQSTMQGADQRMRQFQQQNESVVVLSIRQWR